MIPSPERQTAEKVLRSGPVLRYKPAFRQKALFIERYLELTESMLNYSKKPIVDARLSSCNEGGTTEPLFRIPIDQIEQAHWVDISEVKPPGKLLGNDNLINKIAEEMQEKPTYCFEVQLKGDYENLHLLNNVNCALQRHSKFKQTVAVQR